MDNLKVIIKNKDGETVEENIKAITSFNEKGRFDILPFHENFISVIKDRIIIYKDRDKKEFVLEKAVLETKKNEVKIYLGL